MVFDELDLSREDLGLTTSVAEIRDVFHLAGRCSVGICWFRKLWPVVSRNSDRI